MRGYDDRIATFHGMYRFDYRRRLRIGRGGQCTDNTYGLGNFHNRALRMLFYNANRFVVDNVHQSGAGLALNLEEFAVVIAELGFVHSKLGEFLRHPRTSDGPDHGAYQIVDLLLAVVLNLLLGCPGAFDEAPNFFFRGYFRCRDLLCHWAVSLWGWSRDITQEDDPESMTAHGA